MIKKIIFIVFTLLILVAQFNFTSIETASADELSNNINEQLEQIDFNDLENFLLNVDVGQNYGFFESLTNILKGEYNFDFSIIVNSVFSGFLKPIKNLFPKILGVIVISVLCGIVINHTDEKFADTIKQIVVFASISAIIIILSTEFISIWDNSKKTLENIAKFTEIMSPIMLTLMIAVGGNVSASVYSPTVAFLSNGVINIVTTIILPIIGTLVVFSILSTISTNSKIAKFSDFFCGIIKWIIGIIVTIFTIFLSVQGISSASFDGISIKAAKYAISNSIPLVGGFIKDGFDLIIAGSVLIKNSLGVASVITLFYIILNPVMQMLAFSTLLKLASSITETVSDSKISVFCASLSKCVNYLIACIVAVGFMLFITILLMIISANSIF